MIFDNSSQSWCKASGGMVASITFIVTFSDGCMNKLLGSGELCVAVIVHLVLQALKRICLRELLLRVDS